MIILLRKHPEIEVEHSKLKIQGFLKARITKVNGDVFESDWFPNIITDSGLNLIGSMGGFNPQDYIIYSIKIGTGNSAPTTGDTVLQTLVAATSTNSPLTYPSATPPAAPYYAREAIFGKRFAQGIVGNIAEIGCFNYSDQMFCRALIRDAGGSPTTLTLVATDILDVFYKIKVYPQVAEEAFSAVYGGVTHTGTSKMTRLGTSAVRPVNSAAGTTELSPLFYVGVQPHTYTSGGLGWKYRLVSNGSFSGTPGDGIQGTPIYEPINDGGSPGVVLSGSYVNGTFYRDFSLSFTISLANGNITGYEYYSSLGFFGYIWSPAIIKDNTKTLTLKSRISWARHV
jgi:hypothetical protein